MIVCMRNELSSTRGIHPLPVKGTQKCSTHKHARTHPPTHTYRLCMYFCILSLSSAPSPPSLFLTLVCLVSSTCNILYRIHRLQLDSWKDSSPYTWILGVCPHVLMHSKTAESILFKFGNKIFLAYDLIVYYTRDFITVQLKQWLALIFGWQFSIWGNSLGLFFRKHVLHKS